MDESAGKCNTVSQGPGVVRAKGLPGEMQVEIWKFRKVSEERGICLRVRGLKVEFMLIIGLTEYSLRQCHVQKM